MKPQIHPTAVIEPGARIDDGASVGPYCCIGADVELNAGVVLHSHVVIGGRTRVGAGTTVHSFSSLGHPPQDRSYHGEPASLVVGANNVIREYVTINAGSSRHGTRVGDGCFLMTASHVAHDCQIGNGVIMANQATLGGHVTVGDYAIIGGLSAVHQFVRIGERAMIGGMSGITEDVIPFGMAVGNRAWLKGLNIVGLKRSGVQRPAIHAMRAAYRQLFAQGSSVSDQLEEVARSHGDDDRIMKIVGFLRAASKRGICRPEPGNGG